MILSTGMATVEEIDAAVEAAISGGVPEVALLRCNSAYPAPPEAIDLRAIPAMRERWGVEIGLSDHTLGLDVRHHGRSRSVPASWRST